MSTSIDSIALPEEIVTTPEGTDLHFRTASATERMTAFGIDVALLLLVIILTALVIGSIFGHGLTLLLIFFARQFYFSWSESRSNGSTIGKRRLHLRVIRADGGPMTTEVVLARNFTREVELFLPLQLVLMPQMYHGGHSGIVAIISSIWVILLLLFPLTNRHRLRIGDLLAGTRVVVSPPARLLPDLADDAAENSGHRSKIEEPVFTSKHLSIYGIKELEVLEDVLRKAREHGGKETTAAVMKSIQKKIGWGEPTEVATAGVSQGVLSGAAQAPRGQAALGPAAREQSRTQRRSPGAQAAPSRGPEVAYALMRCRVGTRAY